MESSLRYIDIYTRISRLCVCLSLLRVRIWLAAPRGKPNHNHVERWRCVRGLLVVVLQVLLKEIINTCAMFLQGLSETDLRSSLRLSGCFASMKVFLIEFSRFVESPDAGSSLLLLLDLTYSLSSSKTSTEVNHSRSVELDSLRIKQNNGNKRPLPARIWAIRYNSRAGEATYEKPREERHIWRTMESSSIVTNLLEWKRSWKNKEILMHPMRFGVRENSTVEQMLLTHKEATPSATAAVYYQWKYSEHIFFSFCRFVFVDTLANLFF